MGLLSKVLRDSNMLKISKLFDELANAPPHGWGGEGRWGSALDFADSGNRELGNILHGQDMKSRWEWGGVATPEGISDLSTIQSPSSFGVPQDTQLDDFARNIVVHSHPGWNVAPDKGMQMTSGNLSSQDLFAVTAPGTPFHGVTAIDPDGGFGYAFRDGRAPDIPRDVWNEIKSSAHIAALDRETPTEWYVKPVLELSADKINPQRFSESMFGVSRGIGDALKRAGYLTHYGRIPGSPAAERGEAYLSAMVGDASDSAFEVVRGWLFDKGYPDGVIKGILASLSASGGLAAAAQHISQQEA